MKEKYIKSFENYNKDKPEIIKNIKYWNEKFYGNEKYGYSIYLNNKKVSLNDDEKIQLDEYLSKKSIKEKENVKEKESNQNSLLNKKNIKIINDDVSQKELDSLSDKIMNKQWNGKIYSSYIYLKNEKVLLNDREIKLLKIVDNLSAYHMNGCNDKNVDGIDLIYPIIPYLEKKYHMDFYVKPSTEKILRILSEISFDNFEKLNVDVSGFQGKISGMILKIEKEINGYWMYQKGTKTKGTKTKEVNYIKKLDKYIYDKIINLI
jgi:hypothetical protein